MRDSAATTGGSAGVGDESVDPRDRATGVASAPDRVEEQGAATDHARGQAAVDGAATGDRAGEGGSDGASTATGRADRTDRADPPSGPGGGDRTAVVATDTDPPSGSAGTVTGSGPFDGEASGTRAPGASTLDDVAGTPDRATATPDRDIPDRDVTATEATTTPDAVPRASGRTTGSTPWFERPTYVRPPGMPPPPGPEAAAGEATVTDTPGSEGGAPGASSATSAAPRLRGTLLGAPFPAVPASPATAPAGAPTDATPSTVAGRRPLAVGTARVHEAVRPTRTAMTVPRGPRRARLGLRRVDPWSVMKFSFMVSLVLFIVMIVAASVLYLALDTMGVFASINNTLGELIPAAGGDADTGFRITARGVLGTAALLGGINVVLFTALATLGAFIYNICADLVGGIEITLAERD
jgi:hypothetical protein